MIENEPNLSEIPFKIVKPTDEQIRKLTNCLLSNLVNYNKPNKNNDIFDLHRSRGMSKTFLPFLGKTVPYNLLPKAECTCANRHLFDFGCTCGFLR